MKNIHVLPTDKPSRLFVTDGKLFNYHKPQKGDGIKIINQNIYITSDEPAYPYALHLKNREVFKTRAVGSNSLELYHDKGFSYPEECKKIILTTDQDLIKDGVQAIDDEFLEWFVNNPSCEDVEVKTDKVYNKICDNISYYKIIIPKEESKQETLEEAIRKEYKFRIGSHSFNNPVDIGGQEEIIEESFKNTYLGEKISFNSDIGKAFKLGYNLAKEQDKNRYSYEDMKKAYHCGRLYQGREGDTTFEQFIRTT